MKKYIANIITGSRIAFSLPLLFTPLTSAWFYILYLFCGLTDMIDGTIARKTNAASEFGSKLDTVADFVLVVVCLIKLLPMIHIPVWIWIWIAVIAVIKTVNFAWGFVHMKRFLSVHTVLNKITGFALFLLPLTLTFIEPTYTVLVVCCLATIAAIQERYCVAKEWE